MSKVLVVAEADGHITLLITNTICGRKKLQQVPLGKSQEGAAE